MQSEDRRSSGPRAEPRSVFQTVGLKGTQREDAIGRRIATVAIGDRRVGIRCGAAILRMLSVSMPAVAQETTIGGQILMRRGVPDVTTLIALTDDGLIEVAEIGRDKYFSHVPGVGCYAIWPVGETITIDQANSMSWNNAYIIGISSALGAHDFAKYVSEPIDPNNEVILWTVFVSGESVQKFAVKFTDPFLATGCHRILTGGNAEIAVDNRIVAISNDACGGTNLTLYRPFKHEGRQIQQISLIQSNYRWVLFENAIVGWCDAKQLVVAAIGLKKSTNFIIGQIQVGVNGFIHYMGEIYSRGSSGALYNIKCPERAITDFFYGGELVATAKNGLILVKRGNEYYVSAIN